VSHPLGCQLGQPGPLTKKLEMIVAVAFDWDRDGDVDLVVGDEDGRVALVRNEGSLPAAKTPVFARPRSIE
jgi:hypothetical protein